MDNEQAALGKYFNDEARKSGLNCRVYDVEARLDPEGAKKIKSSLRVALSDISVARDYAELAHKDLVLDLLITARTKLKNLIQMIPINNELITHETDMLFPHHPNPDSLSEACINAFMSLECITAYAKANNWKDLGLELNEDIAAPILICSAMTGAFEPIVNSNSEESKTMSTYNRLYDKFYDAIEEHDQKQIATCKEACLVNRFAMSREAINDLFGLASSEGDIDTASFLLSLGAEIDFQDELSGGTALAKAAANRNLQGVEWLINKGANVNIATNIGSTPLHFVCRHGTSGMSNYYEIAKALIDAGADINAQDEDGTTPLHEAALNCLVDMVILLLSKGADKNITNCDGLTPNQALIDIYTSIRYGSPMEKTLFEQMLPYEFNVKAAEDIITIFRNA